MSLASVALVSLLAVGCGASPEPETEDNFESALRAPGGGAGVGGTRPNVGRRVLELTLSECMRLGGKVVVDDTCPQTTTNTNGGSIVGKFKCKIRSRGLCIDEDTK